MTTACYFCDSFDEYLCEVCGGRVCVMHAIWVPPGPIGIGVICPDCHKLGLRPGRHDANDVAEAEDEEA